MAKTNQVIENKTFGDKVKFLVTAADSDGRLMRMKLWVNPGGDGPPLHVHPLQHETFTMLKGDLNMTCNGRDFILREGESITVPPNTAHTFWNDSGMEVQALVDISPALKGEFFIESVYSLDVQGKTSRKTGLPNLLQFAALLNESYRGVFVVGPPVFAQKIMAKLVGGFAKLIGYKGYIPFPEIIIENEEPAS